MSGKGRNGPAVMRTAQIRRPGGDFEIVERPVPEPAAGEVRVRVEACGICHSDAFVKDGLWPDLQYPRVPGHEIAGRIDRLGEGVRGWKVGDRVGIGWHGGHCFYCPPCWRGDFILCETRKITGITYDGGYAEYTVVPQESMAAIPEELEAAEAAPLLCAGITTFNSLRHSGARPGSLVAVQGIGGLGHLAIQYARKMGFHTVALSRGKDKKDLALELGAHVYIDSEEEKAEEILQKLGGARVILATAPDSCAISQLVAGLGTGGTLLVVAAASRPIEVSPLLLISGRRQVQGWPSGHAADSEDTLRFSSLTQIRPRIETFPLQEANQAYRRMISNQARFRVVLVP